MPDDASRSRRIAILRDEVSRKIAAGEVIDRPFSIVRELLDNSIDAGASSIDVYIEAGGVSRVRVVDDGAGMDREDLELCWQPHATSKIETENDLLTVTSLGFRGEALSSMAVAGRLEIVSAARLNAKPASGAGAERLSPANRLVVRGGKLLGIESCQGREGTAAEVSELFFDFPARKKFLKSPSAESSLCRSIFLDRAIAHPGVAFRLFTDGSLKLFLPTAPTPKRISSAYGESIDERLLGIGQSSGTGFSVQVVAADPSLRKRDRKLLQIFVNRRRIPEYSLMQAAEYGFAGFIPGGWHPIAFVFIESDPSLVDFNIHPAKKEARFRNLPDVHAAVVRATREFLGTRSRAVGGGQAPSRPASGAAPIYRGERPLDLPLRPGSRALPDGFLPDSPPQAGAAERPAGVPARFLGQVFGVFLAFEMEEKLILLDQHAAHEKIIFQRLNAATAKIQELLIPLCFDVSADEDAELSKRLDDLRALGMVLRRSGIRSYQIDALSADFATLPEAGLIEIVKGSIASGEEWRRDLVARAACRLAVKEGDPVDPLAAAELLRAALELEVPRCPHGRPIWHVLSRDELYRLVDRPL
jgi:DNA mismatch repair protein MutL